MAQDYIMRLMQQVAAMLAAVIAKRRVGQIEEAKHDLATLCRQNVGLSLDTVKQLSPDALAAHLTASGALRYPRSVMLAELLIQEAEIHEGQGRPQLAVPNYIHAFCLLSDAIDFLNQDEQDMFRPKLEQLATKLEQLPPNLYTSERIRAYRTTTVA